MMNSKSLANELQEVITKHTEQESAANKDVALEGFPFQVIFAVDYKNNVKVTVRWPPDAPPAQAVRTIASILHHSSSGHWKSPMIEATKKFGVENQQVEVSGQVLQQWAGANHKEVGSRLCVSPRQVFHAQKGL